MLTSTLLSILRGATEKKKESGCAARDRKHLTHYKHFTNKKWVEEAEEEEEEGEGEEEGRGRNTKISYHQVPAK
jgi:hypothetical protein